MTTDVFFPIQPDRKHPLRCAVYDRYMRRSPLKTKVQTYQDIAAEFHISVPTVQRYIRRMESGRFCDTSQRQGRHVYAWDDEALSFFTNFYLAAVSEVGSCTVRNAYNYTRTEAVRRGWNIGSEASAYVHAREISPAMLMLAKGGQRALDNMFYISRDLSKLKPFELIVGDQHRFDFWCLADDGKNYIRAECYLWLDMATRVVYGVSFDENYNTRTVLRSLRMGIQRFGKFDSTYNDNGSGEKSALSDYVIATLQSYGVRFLDEADLYHSDNGKYIVEDTEGCVVDVAKTKVDWERKHRRIFAKVKNAKTKPIERFFNTLEQILRDMCLPGYVKEMGMSAPEEEQASARLAWQRKNGYVLTYDEFIRKVVLAIETYENRIHSSLGYSPKECLQHYQEQGWMPTYIDKRDESFLFMERSYATVHGDRVTLLGQDYIGPDLTKDMVLQNRGTLTAYNRRKIELRYDPENLNVGVFAIEPGSTNAIALRPVEKIDMLDRDQMVKQLEWKKRNIRAVTEAFREATKDKSIRVVSDPAKTVEYHKAEQLAESAVRQIESKADEVVPQTFRPKEKAECLTDRDWLDGVASRIGSESVLRAHGKRVFMTERDRYDDIMKRLLHDERISQADLNFKFEFEEKMTPQLRDYYHAFIRQNGGTE